MHEKHIDQLALPLAMLKGLNNTRTKRKAGINTDETPRSKNHKATLNKYNTRTTDFYCRQILWHSTRIPNENQL